MRKSTDSLCVRRATRAMVLASCGSTILRPRLGIALSTTTRTGGSHLLWERMRLRIIKSQRSSEVFVLPDGPKDVIRHIEVPARAMTRKPSTNDDVETVLSEWWQELLGIDRPGLDDDFFELGGHSLLVVRLFSKLKKTFGVNIDLSSFFEARTIRTLARRIRDGCTTTDRLPSSSQAVVTIRAGGTRRPLYIASGLDGHVLGYHKLVRLLSQDQSVYGLVPRGIDGTEPYDWRVEDIAAYYVQAIRIQQPDGPYRVVGHSFGGIVAFEVAQQLVASGGQVSFVGLLDTLERQYMQEVRRSLRIRDRVALIGSEFRFALHDRDPFGPVRRRLSRYTNGESSSVSRDPYRQQHNPKPRSRTRI